MENKNDFLGHCPWCGATIKIAGRGKYCCPSCQYQAELSGHKYEIEVKGSSAEEVELVSKSLLKHTIASENNQKGTFTKTIMRLFSKKIKSKKFYNVQNRTIDLKGLQAGVPQKFNIGLGSFKLDTKYNDVNEKLQMLDLLQCSLSNDINGVSDQEQRDLMLKKIIETKTQMLEMIMQLNK